MRRNLRLSLRFLTTHTHALKRPLPVSRQPVLLRKTAFSRGSRNPEPPGYSMLSTVHNGSYADPVLTVSSTPQNSSLLPSHVSKGVPGRQHYHSHPCSSESVPFPNHLPSTLHTRPATQAEAGSPPIAQSQRGKECRPVGPRGPDLGGSSPAPAPGSSPRPLPSHLSSSSQSSPPQRSRNSLVFMPPILSRSDL